MGVARSVLLAVILLPGVARASPIVAVFDIEDRTQSLSEGQRQQLTRYLASKLAASGLFRIIPRFQLKKRLRKQKLESYKDCYDQKCQIEIGRELAATSTLSTIVMKLGPLCLVTSVLYNLRTAASEGGASAEGGCGDADLARSIKHAVVKLVAQRRAAARAEAEKKQRRLAAQQARQGVQQKRHTMLIYQKALSRSRMQRRQKAIWGYTGLGTGLGALIAAGVLYGVGVSRQSDADSRYMAAKDQAEMNRGWGDMESSYKIVVAGHVLAGVGALALGVSLYEFLTKPGLPSAPSGPAHLMPAGDPRSREKATPAARPQRGKRPEAAGGARNSPSPRGQRGYRLSIVPVLGRGERGGSSYGLTLVGRF